jgi:hypothetical protein
VQLVKLLRTVLLSRTDAVQQWEGDTLRNVWDGNGSGQKSSILVTAKKEPGISAEPQKGRPAAFCAGLP